MEKYGKREWLYKFEKNIKRIKFTNRIRWNKKIKRRENIIKIK